MTILLTQLSPYEHIFEIKIQIRNCNTKKKKSTNEDPQYFSNWVNIKVGDTMRPNTNANESTQFFSPPVFSGNKKIVQGGQIIITPSIELQRAFEDEGLMYRSFAFTRKVK